MDVFHAIRCRRSIRAYLTKPIPEEVLDRLRQALRFAPSACNFQPWHFIFVVQSGLRHELAQLANGQTWMAQAPVTVVGCGLPDQAYKFMGGCGNSADVDVAIALDHLTLAAVAEGLGTCWIGAFDEAAVKRLLHVPPHAKVVAMTPLGYPASADMNHPLDESRRRPIPEIVSVDRYDDRGVPEG